MSDKEPQNQEEVDSIVADMISETIDALNNLESTRAEFHNTLEECSDLFESGDDAEGYVTLQQLTGTFREFSEFCTSIQQLASCLIPEEMIKDYSEHCSKFQLLLASLLAELENKNFVETADILRYDLIDNINAFYPLFENLKNEFRECLGQRTAS